MHAAALESGGRQKKRAGARGGAGARLLEVGGERAGQRDICDLHVLDLYAEGKELTRERAEHALRKLLAQVVDTVVRDRVHEPADPLLYLSVTVCNGA